MADHPFKLQVARTLKKFERRRGVLLRAVAIEVLTGVTMKTPVDTGQARAGWQAGVNHAPNATTTTLDPSGSATLAKGAAAIDVAQAGDTIRIVNKVPYINRLEWGWSQQAPNGMVRRTSMELRSILSRASAKAKREAP